MTPPMASYHNGALQVMQIFHYASAIAIFLYFVVSSTVSVCTLQTISAKVSIHGRRRKLVLGLMFATLTTYIVESCLFLALPVPYPAWEAAPSSNIYAISSALLWFMLTISLSNSSDPVWYPYYGSWTMALAVETTLVPLSTSSHRPRNSWFHLQLSFRICHILLILTLLGLLFRSERPAAKLSHSDEESQPLLSGAKDLRDSSRTLSDDSKYGSLIGSQQDSTTSAEDEDLLLEAEEMNKEKQTREQISSRLKADGNWWMYMKGFAVGEIIRNTCQNAFVAYQNVRRLTVVLCSFNQIFIPYMWPTKQPRLQLNMLGVGLCLLCFRVLNVLEPQQLGVITNTLGTSQMRVPYAEIGLYLLYILLRSSAGIYAIKQLLWIPIDQYTSAALQTASYNHILGLSSTFHDSKQSGELIAAIDQGSSVTNLLESLLFDIVPMFVDLIIAFTYLTVVHGAYMALIIGSTGIIYLWSSAYLTSLQSSTRRSGNVKYRRTQQVLYDIVGSWRTVATFNRIGYEESRYASLLERYQQTWRKVLHGHYLASGIRGLILSAGFASACFLAAHQIVYGDHKIGTFITLFSYWGEVSGPLRFFSSAHSSLLRDLIDAEKLLQLFQTKPNVSNRPGAKNLRYSNGTIDFDRVKFSYDGQKQILQDISFRIAPGQTVALVGETGGGKSTILKLLLRFYDISSGSISIDGQDVRDVTVESLREFIGVVPQDPKLFNETIMNNIRYSKLEATDEEIYYACKAAAIHDKIMSFTHGYKSKVGELGVKLSGGELQRVAIARAILKDPKIILLDEATSSVDTETESHIQKALALLTQGRTTLVVAHRLSTVVSADLIVVIQDGQVLEKGTHEELLRACGRYHDLWAKQTFIAAKSNSENISPPLVDVTNLPLSKEEPQPTSCIRSYGLWSKSQGSRAADQGETTGSVLTEKKLQREKKNRSHGLWSKSQDSLPADHGETVGSVKSCSKAKEHQDPSGLMAWKPDAPEFVPQKLREVVLGDDHLPQGSECPAPSVPLGVANERSTEQRKSGTHIKGSASQVNETAKVLVDTDGTDDKASQLGTIQVENPMTKRRRNRRSQSKSEPAGHPLAQTGEINDSSLIGSSVPQALSTSSRRVSAPGDPRSGHVTASEVNQATSHRQPYLRRKKQRQTSSTQSNGRMTSWSTDSPETETLLGSSESCLPSKVHDDLPRQASSGSVVRFVPGA